MACGTTLCFLKPLIAVGALAAIGMGGYNLANSGCPLGACDKAGPTTSLTSVEAAKPMKSQCGSCTRGQEAVSSELVAQNSGCEQAGTCSAEMMAACEAMGECPMGMMQHCESGGGSCPMGGSAQAALVAEAADQAACESACEKACEQECEKAAEQTAEADGQTDTNEG